jgi:predicted nucleic acid-binding protein
VFAIDTNVLAYAAFAQTDDRKALAGRIIAEAALGDAFLPMQVLVEFANASLKRSQLSVADTRQRIAEWSAAFPVIATVPGDVLAALDLVAARRLSYFDALIIATARRAGATVLLTEDMHDGLDLDGLTILNPFAASNAARLADLLTLWS